MIEKTTQLIVLFDFYKSLLTEKQRGYFASYYENDWSLSEIAEHYSVSRNAIYDQIQKVEKVLLDYESKLQLVHKYNKRIELIEEIRNSNNISLLDELEEL